MKEQLSAVRVLSVRAQPAYTERAVRYLQESWPEVPAIIYRDCIVHSMEADLPLPQWYLLEKEEMIIGCAGLITNDFISRMDLYPWLSALFVDVSHRGNGYGKLLIDQAKGDARRFGFRFLNLCTDHIGYYEKYGFAHIGTGYHPWEEASRIYQTKL